MKKVTINDIAKKLGVTSSTVSRALADNKRVSEKTRTLIKKVAREMGYQPNLVAASLRRGKSDQIGMIVPRINRHFFSNVISGVEEILIPAGYSLLLMQSHESLKGEINAVHSLMRNRVGGIIASLSAETGTYEHFVDMQNANVPFVQFDRVCNDLKGPKIVNDNLSGAYMATKQLIEAGYKNIVHFGGSKILSAYKEREAGFIKAVEEFSGIENCKIVNNIITREAGYKELKNLIDAQKVDAIFCAGDYAALGVLDALKELKVSVGKEFGVTGFGNEPFAEMIIPSLTTIEQYGNQMGKTIAQEMIKAIDGHYANNKIEIPVEFILRESSKRNI